MLIVSANDWGGNARSTDAIAECFAAERISTATAMVFMADSERAATIARSRELPIGLHLNLTQDFDSTSTPPDVRERQARVVRHFRPLQLRRWTANPFTWGLVAQSVDDQLQRFRVLYGQDPLHVDGHNHVHACPDVFLSGGLDRQTPMRTAQTPAGRRRSPGNLVRAARTAAIKRRFQTPEYFFSIRNIHPEFGGKGLAYVLELSDRASVEIMVHPGFPDEHGILMSDSWNRALDGRKLGSFRSLVGGRGDPSGGGEQA